MSRLSTGGDVSRMTVHAFLGKGKSGGREREREREGLSFTPRPRDASPRGRRRFVVARASQIVFVLMCDGMSTDASPVTFQHLPAAFCMPQLQ